MKKFIFVILTSLFLTVSLSGTVEAKRRQPNLIEIFLPGPLVLDQRDGCVKFTDKNVTFTNKVQLINRKNKKIKLLDMKSKYKNQPGSKVCFPILKK